MLPLLAKDSHPIGNESCCLTFLDSCMTGLTISALPILNKRIQNECKLYFENKMRPLPKKDPGTIAVRLLWLIFRLMSCKRPSKAFSLILLIAFLLRSNSKTTGRRPKALEPNSVSLFSAKMILWTVLKVLRASHGATEILLLVKSRVCSVSKFSLCH